MATAMTKERAEEASHVLMAYSLGQPIQVKQGKYGMWVDTVADSLFFDFASNDYRIKPKEHDVEYGVYATVDCAGKEHLSLWLGESPSQNKIETSVCFSRWISNISSVTLRGA